MLREVYQMMMMTTRVGVEVVVDEGKARGDIAGDEVVVSDGLAAVAVAAAGGGGSAGSEKAVAPGPVGMRMMKTPHPMTAWMGAVVRTWRVSKLMTRKERTIGRVMRGHRLLQDAHCHFPSTTHQSYPHLDYSGESMGVMVSGGLR